MARSRSAAGRVRAPRARGRDRHGRGLRSSVTGPQLPILRGRIDVFETAVADTAEYLRGLWPELDSLEEEQPATSAIGNTATTVKRRTSRVVMGVS